MRVAVAATGKNENARVSEISGRAPYYLLFEQGKLRKVLKNPFRMGGGGAGFGVAKMLADEKTDLVISGKFGENMKEALQQEGIRYWEVADLTVQEALVKAEKPT